MPKTTITLEFEVANDTETTQLKAALNTLQGFGAKGLINLNNELKNNFMAKTMVDKIVKKK